MSLTSFQKKWRRVAARWHLNIEMPYTVELASGTITVPVLLRDFGARRGMLLVTDYHLISAYVDELVGLGFGFSCLSEPREPSHPAADDEALHDMLKDWGWSGAGSPPAWYRGGDG